MAEKLGLGNEVRELKIGQSFTNPKSTAFHTVKYDFKPASVDTSKKATVDVAGNNQVTVTVPHLDGAGVPQTVFKGSQRPYQKECVLIIDRATGEITLEKLSYNIQVKKTRSEYNKLHQDRLSSSQGSNPGGAGGRSQTPPVATGTPQRVSNKTRVTTSGRSRNNAERITTSIPHLSSASAKHSPLRGSPSHQHRSPSMRDQVIPSPMSLSQPAMHLTNNESHSQSALASLPLIGIDDYSDPVPTQPYHHNQHHTTHSQPHQAASHQAPEIENHVGTISDSSSSSSSDSDSDDANQRVGGSSTSIKFGGGTAAKTNGYSNGGLAPPQPPAVNKIDTHLLSDDLCLSESGSDSD